MNLAIFFDPVPEDVFSNGAINSTWQKNIKVFHESFPDLAEIDIALIGVTEERGTTTNVGVSKGANAIRKKLYPLQTGTGAFKIADLGNLRNGETREDTDQRLKEVCETLIANQTIPIILGSSHDLSYGQFLAYENYDKAVTFLNIDATLDMDEDEDNPTSSHLNKVFTHEPNFLFHYAHLGYHSFLTEKEKLEVLEKLYFELYRLGQIRDNFEEAEPVIRTADLLTFDISAIRMSDAPGNKKAQPFGFTGEEACQLCWYAGINSRMSSIGFYEYNPDEDEREKTAAVIATMVWYFTEGYYHRNKEADLNDSRFTKYVVAFKEEPHKLVFYKDTFTDKWWLEISGWNNKGAYPTSALIPCSYKDYETANAGEIPNRWILTNAKLV